MTGVWLLGTGSRSVAAVTTTPTAPSTRQRAALAVLLTASATLAVDFSVLNVALPTIGADVGLALADLQWIATAFALCAAGLTLLMGRVADLLGRRRMFLLGMVLLGLGSLLGGLATTPAVLLTARVAQGCATAVVVPAALALLLGTFPEGPARDRALGLNGALMAAGFTAGAVLGGLLTDLLSWRWAFLLNVPVAAVVLVVGPRVLPERRAERGARLDVPGAVTVTLGLLALVLGLTRAAADGWSDPAALGAFAAAVVLLAAFVLAERRAADPLVPLRVLRRRTVAIGNVVGGLAFATETGLVFVLTLYLQDVLGYTALGAGVSFTALGFGTVLGGLLGPRVIGRFGARTAIVGGLAVQAAATLPLVLASAAAGSIALVLGCTFAGGVANLVVIVGFMVTATSGLPPAEQGLATGLTTMSQQIGITVGAPLLSAVLVGSSDGVLPGVTAAIWLDGVLCVAGAVAAALVLPRRGPVVG